MRPWPADVYAPTEPLHPSPRQLHWQAHAQAAVAALEHGSDSESESSLHCSHGSIPLTLAQKWLRTMCDYTFA